MCNYIDNLPKLENSRPFYLLKFGILFSLLSGKKGEEMKRGSKKGRKFFIFLKKNIMQSK